MADRATVFGPCPWWCRDDHGDITSASATVWHASAVIGRRVPLDEAYGNGKDEVWLDVARFDVTGADGSKPDSDPVTVRVVVDDNTYDAIFLAPPAARQLAEALVAAADRAAPAHG